MTSTNQTNVPLSERINFRLLAFSIIAIVLVGTPIYWYVDEVVSGGIKVRGDVTEVNLKAMSTFPFDQVKGTIEDVPERWRALDGKKVELVGEMYLANSAGDEVRKFDLVYSIAKCCFSGPPQIQHFVQATGRDGKALPYYQGLVKVTGTLHVNVKRGPERVETVYQMVVDSIQQG
ncbi:MAG TPA: hypothetical protein VGN72_15745 [Tepidisphaeraceae bacterium]|nr:hypothetical protein [Tepidisphaeraceae bacterium]